METRKYIQILLLPLSPITRYSLSFEWNRNFILIGNWNRFEYVTRFEYHISKSVDLLTNGENLQGKREGLIEHPNIQKLNLTWSINNG